MGVMQRFAYHEPTSLEAAVALLTELGPAARPLAGGTALLVDLNAGHATASDLVSLTELPGLDRIVPAGDGWRLGALTLLSEVETFAPFQRGAYRALGEAARASAGRQIRNMGTVGGNLCHAAPGADLVPPLLCLDAQLYIVGPAGERIVTLDGFLLGTGRTVLQEGEILTEIALPPIPESSGAAFVKVMRRKAMDCSIVAVAARVTLAAGSDRCAEVRVAVGAAAPVPFVVRRIDDLLRGQTLESSLLDQAAQRAVEQATPVTDVRASADYRRMLVHGLVQRALTAAWQQALAAEEARA
jgi:carbon-monoxide dehydrogenase medium subunit